jgi:hypothetical protein
LSHQLLTIDVEGGAVSALFLAPAGARACYVSRTAREPA